MQIDAQTIVRDGETTTVVLSPWFPREASDMRATLDVIAVSGTTVTLTLKVESKAPDWADADLSTLSNTISRTGNSGPGTTYNLFTFMKGLIRFRYEVTSGGEGDWFLFRVQPLQWYEDVRKT